MIISLLNLIANDMRINKVIMELGQYPPVTRGHDVDQTCNEY